MFKVGDVVKTRDGRQARIICVDCKSKEYPIVALLLEKGDAEEVRSYTRDGRFLHADGETRHDLVREVEVVAWARVNPFHECAALYFDERTARTAAEAYDGTVVKLTGTLTY